MKEPSTLRAFLDELRRRRVYRVGAYYLTGGYVLLEAADLVFPALGVPGSVLPFLIVLWAAGLPVALALAWAYDVTPEGVKADEGGSFTEILGTGRTPRFLVAGVVALVSLGAGVSGWYVWIRPGAAAPPPAQATEVAPDPGRIAVLYFDDHSPGGDLGYLADGLTEGLIHELTQVDPLEVVSRNGVKPFRDQPVSTDDLVARLGAGSIVEGSVTGSPEAVRLTVQLIDGATDTHLESFTFERARDDLFSLQEDLSREVSDALRRRLGEEISLRERRRGTESQEAWTAALRADRLLDDYAALRRQDRDAGRRLLVQADSLLARAEGLDPSWPVPPGDRARVSRFMALLEAPVAGAVDPEWARRGIAHAERALALDPDHAPALHLAGALRHELSYQPDQGNAGELRTRAGRDLQRAVEAAPGLAAAWVDLSEWLMDEGRFAESQRAAAQAQEADAFLELPHDVLYQYYYALVQEGPVEEARAVCEEGYARFPGSSDFLTCQLFVLASFPQAPADVDRAWMLRDSLVAVASAGRLEDLRTFGTLHVAKVAARAGLADSARAVLRRARGEETPEHLTYDEAHFWVLMEEPDSAVDLLQRYLEAYADTVFIAQDWWFEPLHRNPEFRELVGMNR